MESEATLQTKLKNCLKIIRKYDWLINSYVLVRNYKIRWLSQIELNVSSGFLCRQSLAEITSCMAFTFQRIASGTNVLPFKYRTEDAIKG